VKKSASNTKARQHILLVNPEDFVNKYPLSVHRKSSGNPVLRDLNSDGFSITLYSEEISIQGSDGVPIRVNRREARANLRGARGMRWVKKTYALLTI
jgi:hypothetical protein